MTISQAHCTVLLIGACVCLGCGETPKPSPSAPAVTTAPSSIPPAPTAKEGKPTPDQILTLSSGAADRLRMIRDKGKLKSNAIVRIAVVEGNFFRMKNGGDKRYKYTLLLDDDPKDLDKYFTMQTQGLEIHVPKDCAELLRGTEIIWIESGGKGGLKFLNPHQMTDDESNQVVPVADPEASKPTDKAPGKTGQTPTPINEEPAPKGEGRNPEP